MEDAPSLLKIPKSECPDIWIRLPKHKWPKSWSSMEDPVVPLERNLYGHPLAGLLWHTAIRESSCLFVNREKRTILICACGRYKLAGKKQNISPTWKTLMKDVDLGDPTSFLDHVYLVC